MVSIIRNRKLLWPVVLARGAHGAEKQALEDLCAYLFSAAVARVPFLRDAGRAAGPAIWIGPASA